MRAAFSPKTAGFFHRATLLGHHGQARLGKDRGRPSGLDNSPSLLLAGLPVEDDFRREPVGSGCLTLSQAITQGLMAVLTAEDDMWRTGS